MAVTNFTLDEAALVERFDQLVKDGIIFYDADPEIIHHEDPYHRLSFEFHITRALENKPNFTSSPSPSPISTPPSAIPGSDINVSGFEIGPVGPSHLLTFNMFSGARPHFLLLTADGHRRQHEPLDREDLAAARACLEALGGGDDDDGDEYTLLYNGGEDAGCSRVHKHMQLLPRPRGAFTAWRHLALDGADLPYVYCARAFPSSGLPEPEALLAAYAELLGQAGAALRDRAGKRPDPVPGAGDRAPAHNVILDREGIVVIPRQTAEVSGLSANAAGMFGMLWMSDKAKAKGWKESGPVDVLRALGVASEPHGGCLVTPLPQN